MTNTNFFLEFDLSLSEIRKLNKMYFKGLYHKRILFVLSVLLLGGVFFDFFNSDNDLTHWIIRTFFVVACFLFFQYLIVNAACRVIFQVVNKLLEFEGFVNKYKFRFTSSFICIDSPLGAFTHKWCYIEKAILTKDFFFLYFRDKNGYIVSISNKYKNRKIDELVAFLQNNVTPVIKV